MKIPQRAPTYTDLIRKYLAMDDPTRLAEVLTSGGRACVQGRYRHWDKVRHLTPPGNFTIEEWWLAIKVAREKLWKEVSLRDISGAPFKYAMPDEAHAMVHQITRDACGSIDSTEEVVNPDTRERYVINSLIEEAVTSSQLEGAATTTPVAKEMIRSGRKPRDTSERMILNNYLAIRAIREFADEPLSPERVMEIHGLMTEGTLDAAGADGRLRNDSEYRVVVSAQDEVRHRPPPARELARRMDAMCSFANDRETFVDPVVRAILLHFWLAYDHPFVDGNGRTARALFYWSMLSQGYWLCEYISISSIIKRAPAKYARAFLYTETDENDATYFILNQLDVTGRAIRELHTYLRNKTKEIADTEQLLKKHVEFNHRQLALLSHALRHPGFRYTIRSHQTSHGVVYETARSDLLDLATKELLDRRKVGKTFVFVTPEDLSQRLRDFG